jgi:hypothetical protein
MSASSQAAPDADPAVCVRFAVEPAPIENPSAMKISSAETLRPASRFVTRRPGPTPRRWISDMIAIAASAMIDCREIVRGTTGSGIVRIAVVSFAAGTKRPR